MRRAQAVAIEDAQIALADGDEDAAVDLGDLEQREVEAVEVGLDLELLELPLDLEEAPRLAGVNLERAHLAIDFFDDVGEAEQVVADLLELELDLALAHAEARDAGRLLEDAAPVDGVAREDAVDLPLLHERVAARDESGPEEEVAHVLQADGLLVDEVFALARAEEAARDDDVVGLDRQHAVLVVEVEGSLGHPHRRAAVGAVEDDVRHLLPAQRSRALLAEDPLHGVDDVRLPAPVRTDDPGEAAVEDELSAVRERLESVDLEFREPHGPAALPGMFDQTPRKTEPPRSARGWPHIIQ